MLNTSCILGSTVVPAATESFGVVTDPAVEAYFGFRPDLGFTADEFAL